MTISKWQLALAASATCAIFVAPFAEASTYTVQSGDSLYQIAKKHNVTINNLKEWNNLSSSRLHINQELIVSKDAVASIELPETADTSVPPTTTETYKVAKGDTLSKIARKHHTTVAKLKEWNDLSSDLIKIGQELIVKKDSTTNSSSSNANTGNSGTTTASPPQNAVDKMIAAQLAKEKMITKSPSATSLAQYDKLIELAKSFIGVPYVFGGNSPSGFDCSGFISYVYNEAGIKNTRRSALDYFTKATTVVKNPVPGDLVFFKNTYISTVSHIGIYLGNGEMIHAGSKGIEITKLSYAYWSDRQVAFKRFNNVK